MTPHLYADDTQLYIAFEPNDRGESRALEKMSDCVNDVRRWMAYNDLKLNDDKTEIILFGTAPQCKKVKFSNFSVGNQVVTLSDKVKNIGVVLDSNMTFQREVLKTCKTAWFYLYKIRKIRKHLSIEQTKVIVHAFVISRLDRNNSLFVGITEALINKLQRVQNAAARLIFSAGKFDSVTPLLISLHWLPIKARIDFKVLLLVYKCKYDKAPEYLKELVKQHVPTRALRSGMDATRLVVPRTSSSYGDRAFGVAGPRMWNSLPMAVKQSTSVAVFKTKLKTHLFTQHFKAFL